MAKEKENKTKKNNTYTRAGFRHIFCPYKCTLYFKIVFFQFIKKIGTVMTTFFLVFTLFLTQASFLLTSSSAS